MIYELVQHTVAPDFRDQYIEIYKAAWKKAAFAGSHEGKVMKAMEDDARVDVLIEWDSLAAHRQHRGTPAQVEFLATVRAHQTAPSKIEHFTFEDLPSGVGSAT
jgi:heme-degrading monooxygenase HmoA